MAIDAQSFAIIISAVGTAVAGIIAAYRAGLNKPAPGCTCSQDSPNAGR